MKQIPRLLRRLGFRSHAGATLKNSTLILILSTLLLSLPALLNGQPFFYNDTTTYIRGANQALRHVLGESYGTDWAPAETNLDRAERLTGREKQSITSLDEKTVLAGRSVYYGAALLIAYFASNLWLMVFFQALCTAFLIRVLVQKCIRLDPLVCYLICLFLALSTSLGYFTGLLMPDIFAGLTILTIVTLSVYWAEINGPERAVLTALLLFGLISHTSHIILAGAVIGFLGLTCLLPRLRDRLYLGAIGIGCACVILAVLSELSFHIAVTQVLGEPPMRLPHLTAHLVELGPGLDYLKRNCTTVHFTVCAFVDRLPVHWIEFLFSHEPDRGVFALADPPTKRALAGEQMRFFVSVFLDAPLALMRALSLDVLEQLFRFGMSDIAYLPSRWSYFEARLPPATWAAMQESRAFGNEAIDAVLTGAVYTTTTAGVIILAFYYAVSARRQVGTTDGRRAGAFSVYSVFVLLGVALNAAACAVLASPFDRFQARVIWLIPLLALLALGIHSHHRPRMDPSAATE